MHFVNIQQVQDPVVSGDHSCCSKDRLMRFFSPRSRFTVG